jgi:UDP-3-O-[3-hydroxymyristoyl] glucosamine N-acyltransferase
LYTLSELAALVEGSIVGDPALPIVGVSEIQHGRPGTITFLGNPKYRRYLDTTEASAVLVTEADLLQGKPGIVVANPQLAMARILDRFRPELEPLRGIHPTAVVDATARIGEQVAIGAYAVVEARATIGSHTTIGHHTVIGQEATIEERVYLHPRVTIYPRCVIGADTLIHSGTVIGSDGFGFVTEEDQHHKIPQVGRVVIGRSVEIGANCTLDRGTIGDTIIGDGTKLDNLVHIAHNVQVGKGCLLTAQVGIAGSVEIGDGCIFAGQSGVAPHVKIGPKAVFAAKTGVTKSLPGGKVYAGMPAREIREQHRREAVYTEILRLKKRLLRLEQK